MQSESENAPSVHFDLPPAVTIENIAATRVALAAAAQGQVVFSLRNAGAGLEKTFGDLGLAERINQWRIV